ncbi:DUF3296 domain-containing protein [Salmonella enterica]|nr:DUF3296 domain-containing protein [Salmonella enterica]EBR2564404.1 DUF3296 domain-containing protein [Salmonella enterica]EEG9243078.1 DUF3296 domain-containing protein [Salmonella enterica]
MNNHHTDATAADAPCTRVFLQQAVDHYPRLAAFSFTLALPYRESMVDRRSLILRFHTEVWQRIGEYSWKRQQERRSSPPTRLRWVWESASAPVCRMVLLMNLDTLGMIQDAPPAASVLQGMSMIITDAGRAVTDADGGITGMSSFIISRAERGGFTQSFNLLQARVQEMASPVAMTRTGVICP